LQIDDYTGRALAHAVQAGATVVAPPVDMAVVGAAG